MVLDGYNEGSFADYKMKRRLINLDAPIYSKIGGNVTIRMKTKDGSGRGFKAVAKAVQKGNKERQKSL